ncbi:hypothetical protein BU16DRAFT_251993 [Lophium mytilinum]|uniref:Uncharacterized protein n=1 Tax=Lophium mytilinum TaxID=390894 RepID=A0A6A6R7P5_9PEZI|nr:hypothetical protein BU16DRAFT_251993 [Lophium mytilinum]
MRRGSQYSASRKEGINNLRERGMGLRTVVRGEIWSLELCELCPPALDFWARRHFANTPHEFIRRQCAIRVSPHSSLRSTPSSCSPYPPDSAQGSGCATRNGRQYYTRAVCRLLPSSSRDTRHALGMYAEPWKRVVPAVIDQSHSWSGWYARQRNDESSGWQSKGQRRVFTA